MVSYMELQFNSYIKDRFVWDQYIIDSIWWNIHHRALLTFKPPVRQIIQKFNFDKWSCNRRQGMISEIHESTCEACGRIEESCDHILQCDNPAQAAICDDFNKSFNTFLTNSNKSIKVITCLKEGLSYFFHKQKNLIILVPNASFILCRAYENQVAIGWCHFLWKL